MSDKLTPEEKSAIRALKRLEKSWPESLWLFTNGQALYVMKCDAKGKRRTVKHGGMDADAIVAQVSIPSDGGDW